MPSSEFSSNYLNLTITVETDTEVLVDLCDFINEYPEGSARRMEIESAFFKHLANYVEYLASTVRAHGKVTLYED